MRSTRLLLGRRRYGCALAARDCGPVARARAHVLAVARARTARLRVRDPLAVEALRVGHSRVAAVARGHFGDGERRLEALHERLGTRVWRVAVLRQAGVALRLLLFPRGLAAADALCAPLRRRIERALWAVLRATQARARGHRLQNV